MNYWFYDNHVGFFSMHTCMHVNTHSIAVYIYIRTRNTKLFLLSICLSTNRNTPICCTVPVVLTLYKNNQASKQHKGTFISTYRERASIKSFFQNIALQFSVYTHIDIQRFICSKLVNRQSEEEKETTTATAIEQHHVTGRSALDAFKSYTMVCSKCEKKLSKTACMDTWKASSEKKTDGRKLNENKILSKSKRWQPYTAKCKLCKSSLPENYMYCQKCSYAKGLCGMCGRMILKTEDLKRYKQSTA